MIDYLRDFLMILGIGLFVYGVSLIYVPLAFMVAGAFCIYLGWPRNIPGKDGDG